VSAIAEKYDRAQMQICKMKCPTGSLLEGEAKLGAADQSQAKEGGGTKPLSARAKGNTKGNSSGGAKG